MRKIAIGFVVALCCACGDSKSSSSSASNDPLVVAHSVLTAYKAKNWDGLAKLVAPRMAKRTKNLAKAIEKNFDRSWKVPIGKWDGKAPTDVRYAYYKGTAAETTEAMVRFAELSERELAAVRLVKEDGKWWFGKLISPSLKRYESMPTSMDGAMKAYKARK